MEILNEHSMKVYLYLSGSLKLIVNLACSKKTRTCPTDLFYVAQIDKMVCI